MLDDDSVLPDTRVGRLNQGRIVFAFQSTDGEMAVRHVLEVLDEDIIDECPADGSDDGDNFRRRFLR